MLGVLLESGKSDDACGPSRQPRRRGVATQVSSVISAYVIIRLCYGTVESVRRDWSRSCDSKCGGPRRLCLPASSTLWVSQGRLEAFVSLLRESSSAAKRL